MALWALRTPDLDRATLERQYLQSPGDMVRVLDQPLHVRDSGPQDAPAVLLIHGFGASLHTWEPWAQTLSQHLRVLRLDLPGSGLSPPDVGNDYSDTRSIALITALLDARGLQSVDIEVDGGINPTTAKQVIAAGANVLVAGNAVFKAADYKSAIASLR